MEFCEIILCETIENSIIDSDTINKDDIRNDRKSLDRSLLFILGKMRFIEAEIQESARKYHCKLNNP